MLYEVIITYENGETVKFPAQEFDIDLRHTQARPRTNLNKYTYIDSEGNETPIHALGCLCVRTGPLGQKSGPGVLWRGEDSRTPDPIYLYTTLPARLRLYTPKDLAIRCARDGPTANTRRGAVGPSSLLLLPGVVLPLADRGPAS